MVYSIDDIRNRIAPLAEKYHIPAIYLFGSYARGEATETSDLDFLVDTTGTELNSLLKLGALYCDLEAAFGKEIDLITVRTIMQPATMESDIDFRDTVLKERVELYAVA